MVVVLKNMGLESDRRGTNLVLLFLGSVTLSKLLNFSKPQFSHQ